MNADNRVWAATDRPAEQLTISRPRLGLEVMSARHSNRHWREVHKGFTLGVIHAGQPRVCAEWRTRRQTLASRAGEVMAMEPGDLHVTDRVHVDTHGADFDVVTFSPELVKAAAHELGLSGAFHFKTPAISDPYCFASLEKLVAAVAAGTDPLETECAAAQALHTLITRSAETPPPSGVTLDPVRDHRLRRVRDYLSQNLVERPTLQLLEHVAGLGQYRLCAVFKQAFGVSIGRYWNVLRLAEATRRLQKGTPAKLVVAELGYKDEGYLWRVFKRHYGMPPGAWLALYRANDWVPKQRQSGDAVFLDKSVQSPKTTRC